jgi:hypothetical protein
VSALVITFGYIGNNSAALLEDMWDPPHKIRSVKQTLGSRILRNFNRVAFLEIRQALPACGTIFLFNTQVPTLGCFPQFIVASMLDVHISMFNGMSISFVINNAIRKIIFSAFNITLGIHIICNHIGGIFITAAIRKLNFISPGVQN